MVTNAVRTPHPRKSLQPWMLGLQVAILVALVAATVTLVVYGVEPGTAVATIGAAGLAAAEIATRLVASTSRRRR